MTTARLREQHIIKLLNAGVLHKPTIDWLNTYGFAVVYDEHGLAVRLVEIEDKQ